jgi:hypothetical protein
MEDDLVYVPEGDDSFVELSRTQSGKLFRKHILSKGPLYYKGNSKPINVDDAFLDNVVKNFNDHVVSHVQAPVVDSNNSHSEDPFRNIGEVVRVERDGDKLYSVIDVRKNADDVGKTLLGASALFHLNWRNTRTNKYVGPALVHTAITNNAHQNDLEDFEEVRLSYGSNDSTNQRAVFLSATPDTEESKMDLDEIIAVLRDEHKIDLVDLQKRAEKADDFAKLSADLQEKLTSGEDAVLKLSAADETATNEDIVAAVADLVQSRVELSNTVNTLVEESKTAKAEARIEELVAGGFIAPAKRDAHLRLLLSSPEAFEDILPEKPLVALSSENGHETHDETHDETVATEIARLSADAASQGYIRA